MQCAIDGNALKRIEARALDVLEVIHPQTAGNMLGDWERLLGIKQSAGNYQDRVNRVMIKLNMLGGLSIPYFTRLAESIGYRITIKEFSPLTGDLPPLLERGEWASAPEDELIFMWRVDIANGEDNIRYFRAGSSCAGERLTDFGDPIIEALFKELKPAHTYCYFAYVHSGVTTP